MSSVLSLPSPVGVDHTTAPDLPATLREIRLTPGGWRTPAATQLLAAARQRLAPAAAATGADPDEAVSYAFQVWSEIDIAKLDGAIDMWAYTFTAVRNCLQREAEAARKLTSVEGVRRVHAQDVALIARIAPDDQTFDFVVAGLDGRHPGGLASSGSPDVRSPAIIAVKQVLVMVGFDSSHQDRFFDLVAAELHGSGRVRSAAARLLKHKDATTYPVTPRQWRALIALLLGTMRGRPGLVQLIAEGHPSPMSEPQISGGVNRLLGVEAA